MVIRSVSENLAAWGGGGFTLELLNQLLGEFNGEPIGVMLVQSTTSLPFCSLSKKKRKSQKIVGKKTCAILLLIFTPDPPFDLLLSALSMISTVTLTG
jgi:hypothetical protein